ncbi:DoxX family protein [Sphingomonas sp. TX0543]|uniref:DoxX family protein n=1 Tax=Sphingomonas sp. TX0543 TaxID=3399682 RepID=UPI003AFAFED5
MEQTLAAWRPYMLSILRIMAALLFMEHGLMKLFAFPLAQPGAPSPLPTILIVAAVIEIIGGVLIAVGFFTRLAAFICAGQMAFAYFGAHAPKGFWPGGNGGDAAILFCFVFLYLVFAGPGSWSLDAMSRARGR